MTNWQQIPLYLSFPEPIAHIVYEVPEYAVCQRHGEWCVAAYYTEDEIIDDIDKQGFLDCPFCLLEMVSWESI